MAKPESTDQYISSFPAPTAALLQQLRETVVATAPEAVEVISYSMPAFKVHGKMLVWFAGYGAHIGFYPGGSGIAAFQKEIAGFKNSKGAVQFPLDKPLPVDLIEAIVKFKLQENAEALALKKKKK